MSLDDVFAEFEGDKKDVKGKKPEKKPDKTEKPKSTPSKSPPPKVTPPKVEKPESTPEPPEAPKVEEPKKVAEESKGGSMDDVFSGGGAEAVVEKEPSKEQIQKAEQLWSAGNEPSDSEPSKPTRVPLTPETLIPSRSKPKTYDLSEEKPTRQVTHMWWGLKGAGKTFATMKYPGRIAAISFDRKTSQVKEMHFKDDTRIKVFDGIRYLDKSDPERWCQSAIDNYEYLMQLIDGPIRDFNPDWILIDGTEVLIRDVCEMAMRGRENIQAFAGVEWNLWKERVMYSDNIYTKCLRIANQGILFTAFVKETVEKIERGVIIEQQYHPRWAGNIKLQVDTVIHVESRQVEDQREFWATVDSSKNPDIITGLKVNITGGGIKTIWDESKKRLKR